MLSDIHDPSFPASAGHDAGGTFPPVILVVAGAVYFWLSMDLTSRGGFARWAACSIIVTLRQGRSIAIPQMISIS